MAQLLTPPTATATSTQSALRIRPLSENSHPTATSILTAQRKVPCTANRCRYQSQSSRQIRFVLRNSGGEASPEDGAITVVKEKANAASSADGELSDDGSAFRVVMKAQRKEKVDVEEQAKPLCEWAFAEMRERSMRSERTPASTNMKLKLTSKLVRNVHKYVRNYSKGRTC